MKWTALVLFAGFCLLWKPAASLDRSDCKCRVPAQRRIVGGTKVAESYPWHVSIRENDNSTEKSPDEKQKLGEDYKLKKLRSGGIVLNQRWVLTTAQTFSNSKKPAADYVVQFGGNDLVELYDRDQYVEIEEVIKHPEFYVALPAYYNDLALVKLKTPLRFTDGVQPACLGVQHQNPFGGPLRMVGFGSNITTMFDLRTGDFVEAQHSRQLKGADVVDQTNSLALCKGFEKLAICAKAATGKGLHPGTPCDADDGSPLHTMSAGKATVVGLYSFNDRMVDKENGLKATFCYEEHGSVYVRTSSYIHWLEKHIGRNYCQ